MNVGDIIDLIEEIKDLESQLRGMHSTLECMNKRDRESEPGADLQNEIVELTRLIYSKRSQNVNENI